MWLLLSDPGGILSYETPNVLAVRIGWRRWNSHWNSLSSSRLRCDEWLFRSITVPCLIVACKNGPLLENVGLVPSWPVNSASSSSNLLKTCWNLLFSNKNDITSNRVSSCTRRCLAILFLVFRVVCKPARSFNRQSARWACSSNTLAGVSPKCCMKDLSLERISENSKRQLVQRPRILENFSSMTTMKMRTKQLPQMVDGMRPMPNFSMHGNGG